MKTSISSVVRQLGRLRDEFDDGLLRCSIVPRRERDCATAVTRASAANIISLTRLRVPPPTRADAV